MDVHHAKHPSHKKKWAEYLLEFFMLFLAVFLGFLTENVREHMIERKKEKQLILSLARDLEKDSSDLNHIISNMVLHDQWVDSAILALRSNSIKGREKEISYVLNNATIWQLYSAPDVTINQIRTSGVFNLIKNDSVRKGILDYMSNLNNYIKYSEPLVETRHDEELDERIRERLPQGVLLRDGQAHGHSKGTLPPERFRRGHPEENDVCLLRPTQCRGHRVAATEVCQTVLR